MLKEALRNGVHGLGFHFRRNVPNDKVSQLFARLRPVTTAVPLIRLGGEGDGGYLVPDDLDGVTACFSPGVDVTATFERDLIERGIPCFLADASVERAPFQDPALDFERKFLGVVNDDMRTTLDDWVSEKQPNGGEFILQMDIEGAEWPVLLNVSDQTLASFRIIVLELHALPNAFDSVVFSILDACLERLGKTHHVVHVHPNNFVPPYQVAGMEIPHFLEVTYLRKDRAEATGVATEFPHFLDRPNIAENPDFPLPQIFRRPV